MEQVSFELIRRVRLHIQRTEKQAKLLEKQKEWLKLTAALDVLEDTSNAVEYYCDSEYPVDVRGKYLFTYGLLQALFLQQDAINGINEALFDNSINYKDQYPTAYAVREMRNDVVGHPTNRSGGKQYIYLVQCSLEKESFDYIKEEHDREGIEAISVDVFAAISDTGKAINTILNSALHELDTEFINYINAHKERKMKEIFSNLGYTREKVILNTELKSWGYEATKAMMTKCEEEIVRRYGSIETADSYPYLLSDIHKVYDLIDTGLPRIPKDLFPHIEKCLLENLFHKLDKLKSFCVETDEYFENYGQELTPENEDTSITINIVKRLSE